MKMLICGTGTLGGNLVEHLARTGVYQLSLLDCDRVESHNLANQPYYQHQLGKSKVAALAETIYQIRGQKLQTMHKCLDSSNARTLVKNYDLVVDCFDNHKARMDLQQACRALQVPLLHLGLSIDYGEVIWDEVYCVPPDVERDSCRQPLSRTLALYIVLLFDKAISECRSFCFTARDLVVSEL